MKMRDRLGGGRIRPGAGFFELDGEQRDGGRHGRLEIEGALNEGKPQ